MWIQILDTGPEIEKTVMKWWANYGKIVLTDFSALSLNLWKEGPPNLGQHINILLMKSLKAAALVILFF